MERTFIGYANYGVLAHESQTIYTAGNPEATATFAEEVVFVVPEKWETAENEAGELLLSPDGETYYMPYQILSQHGGKPCFRWFDGIQKHWIVLKYSETGRTVR